MRFYKVKHWSGIESSEGFAYFTTKREAEQDKKEYEALGEFREATIKVIDVKPTKAGILEALRRNGSHNDNG